MSNVCGDVIEGELKDTKEEVSVNKEKYSNNNFLDDLFNADCNDELEDKEDKRKREQEEDQESGDASNRLDQQDDTSIDRDSVDGVKKGRKKKKKEKKQSSDKEEDSVNEDNAEGDIVSSNTLNNHCRVLERVIKSTNQQVRGRLAEKKPIKMAVKDSRGGKSQHS